MGKRDYMTTVTKAPTVVLPHSDETTKLSDVFFALTRQLSEQLYINRGVLVLRDRDTDNLAAVSTWQNGNAREGLSIRLPSEKSLFEHVAADGQIYTEDFCGSFSGNFFERKLLIDESSRSFVLQPIKYEGEVVGLLGFSSEAAIAFSLFEEGAMDQVISNFAELIHRCDVAD